MGEKSLLSPHSGVDSVLISPQQRGHRMRNPESGCLGSWTPLFPRMRVSPVAGIPVWKAYFLLIGFTALLK